MSPKEIAVEYLKLVSEGKIDEAYDAYIDPKGWHHNVYTAAGFEALRTGMKEAEARFPGKKLDIKHIIADGNMVAIHSHLTMNPSLEVMTVHIFRVEQGKIVEMWDCGQQIPEDSPNKDGFF